MPNREQVHPNREQVQTAMARLLLKKVREDHYPSVTQMELLEQIIPPRLIGDYITVLLAKVAGDDRPSIPMLHRIRRIAEQLPG